PLHPELARTLRDTCIKYRIPYFFKLWGHWLPVENTKDPAWQHGGPPKDWPWNQRDPRIEMDPTEPWRYFALGKTQTGNTLDNRQHLHIPNRNCALITQDDWRASQSVTSAQSAVKKSPSCSPCLRGEKGN
ncbi:MAG: DUF5131 family protein, partial [Candidatus Hydrogenedentes bacterium]|nr:DUF5131 family protein [Candidatus Hydrogenedentota bacterium]